MCGCVCVCVCVTVCVWRQAASGDHKQYYPWHGFKCMLFPAPSRARWGERRRHPSPQIKGVHRTGKEGGLMSEHARARAAPTGEFTRSTNCGMVANGFCFLSSCGRGTHRDARRVDTVWCLVARMNRSPLIATLHTTVSTGGGGGVCCRMHTWKRTPRIMSPSLNASERSTALRRGHDDHKDKTSLVHDDDRRLRGG